MIRASTLRAILSLLLLSLSAPRAWAQEEVPGLDPARAITQYHLDHWSTNEGLPQNTVRAVLQTRDGYLWLGTQEGLARFDGLRFTVFDKASGKLGYHYVTALAEDEARTLWVGTMGGGLFRRRGDAFEVYAPGGALPSQHVNALLAASGGDLWVGTADAGLCRIRDERADCFSVAEGLPDPEVVALYEDHRGGIWAGLRRGGLVQVHDRAGAQPSFASVAALQHAYVTAVTGDEAGRLWVGTREHGLFELADGDVRRHYTRADGLPGDGVLVVERDAYGTLWLGLDRGGLGRLHDGRITSFSTQDGLSHDLVRALLVDREGSLWIGTDGGGLDRLRDGKFVTYTAAEGMRSELVAAVYEDRRGAVWAGTEGGGASRIADGRVTNYTTAEGLPSDVVYAFAETPDGSLWMGTYGGGLVRLRQGRLTTYTTADGLADDSVFGLHTDARGTLWIATGKGLGAFRDERFTTYTTADGLASNVITALADDSEGNLWVGTYDSGLDVLRNGQVQAHFGEGEGLRSSTILALHVDAQGTIWVGTNEGGLHRIRDGRVDAYTTADGLPSDKVFAIVEDDAERLWVTSNKGLFSIAREALDRFGRARGEKLHPTVYGRHDGLRSTEFTGGLQPGGWKSRDGRLWFASSQGAVSIHPLRIRLNRQPPLVVLESMLADGTLVPTHAAADEPIHVAPGPRKFEFHYTGLSFLAPDQVRFRYRLEGADEDWVDAGTRREAFYTNLSPGTYTFRVMAQNSDGTWSEADAAVSFYLEPFFYQTVWFYLLLVLALAGMLLGFYRWRVRHLRLRQRELEDEVAARTRDLLHEKERTEAALREAEHQRSVAEQAREVIEEQAEKLREMDKIKTRFFNNISHEFRTPLTLTIGPLENALTGLYGPLNDALRGQLELMLRNARRLLRLINQLLDLSKLESDKVKLHLQHGDIVAFLEGIVLSFSAFTERKGLKLDFTAEAETLPLAFDPECMEKVFFNLLSNAVKFTPEGGRISVWVGPGAAGSPGEPPGVEVRVEDTGQGIPAEDLPYVFDRFHQVDGAVSSVQEGTGIGLALVKELVALHGGTIEAASTYGAGTTFRLHLPAGPAPEPAAEPELPGELQGDGQPYGVPLVSRGPMIEMAVFDEEEELPELAPEPAVEGRPTLMVVDDNRDIRDYMMSCLRDQYVLRLAVDGLDALEQIRRQPPDLVISDVMMPRMDGYELCRALKADEALAHIPVILLTAKASTDDRIEGLEAGADDYLAKPFNAKELQARVRNLLTLREQQKALRQTNDALACSNQALQEANALKSQLLHIAAHDLKTPLHSIRGFAEVLQDELADGGETHELLDMIMGAADRMTTLISQILEAEALESGRLELELRPVDLEALARSVVSHHRQSAEAKQQQIVFAAEEADLRVAASTDWMREALENLVSNAVKYSPHGKTIWVDVAAGPEGVRFSVRDEGPGIQPLEQALLFKKFQRLSTRPTGNESSTGLGLSIVKLIVELHGGTVWAESAPGVGSTFFIELPACAEAPVEMR